MATSPVSAFFTPATVFNFKPLLSDSNQASIMYEVAAQARMRARRACEDALLQHIHDVVHEQEVFHKLLTAVGKPHTGMVSIDLFRFGASARMKVNGCEKDMSIGVLLLRSGRIMQSLNEGLGRNFRVTVRYPPESPDRGSVIMEFSPDGFPPRLAPVRIPHPPPSGSSSVVGIMNPEDEEESVILPTHPDPESESE